VAKRSREVRIELAGIPSTLTVVEEHPDALQVLGDGEPRAVRVLAANPHPLVLVGSRVVSLARAGEAIVHRGRALVARVRRNHNEVPRPSRQPPGGVLHAPMPGRVISVSVAPGDSVAEGAALLVLEAMKMQNELFAASAGVVVRVFVAPGDAVERGAPLVEISS